MKNEASVVAEERAIPKLRLRLPPGRRLPELGFTKNEAGVFGSFGGAEDDK